MDKENQLLVNNNACLHKPKTNEKRINFFHGKRTHMSRYVYLVRRRFADDFLVAT